MLACEYGHKVIVKGLILRGADINVKSRVIYYEYDDIYNN
jgi:hypothetical protein